MNSKHIMRTIACAAALCGSVRAENTNETPKADDANSAVQPSTSNPQSESGWNWAMGEGISYDETPIVTTELGVTFDSKYLSYGLVDNNDPIFGLEGTMTFFDWFYIGSSALFDMSRYGIDAGYKNRGGKAIEYHPTAGLTHAFGPDDCAWLPTTVELTIGYDYEYHPRVCEAGPCGGDTQFWTAEVSLPDLWLEPTFLYERDTMRDQGTYLNFELGHTFALVDGAGEDDDPALSIRPSVAQGWGNSQRVRAYLNEEDDDGNVSYVDHAGLMDTTVKLDLTWNICAGVSLSGYVAYVDYLFDPSMADAATRYEATGHWDKSWNFVAGAALAVTF